ncbi:MAG: DNA polymerase domain-containing protein, partial [archaeon]|nr:DNA polymerase domain-containing protein [archaeon]
ARVCRRTLQALVAHSVGNASNNRLLYEAYRRGYLIPYKVGIYERIKPFSFLLENDRGPFTYEPLIGFHSQVYELDFASMYPSIMAAYNLSPEKFRCACCPLEPILATGYSFCRKKKGIVPRVCAYLIRRRQAYKQRDDSISRAKVAYLKWLLVVIFGYQACTHKKIGTIEIHETINAIARETMVDTIHLAEAHGFRVLHAIVDALYVTKKNAPIQDVHALIVDVNAKTGLTLEYKHTFQRMAFLPSLVNTSFPVPGRFYGLTTSGKIKARGIEARQKSQPAVIKSMQRDVLAAMGRHPRSTPYELFRDLIPILRRHLDMLPYALPEHLAFTLRLGREEYHTNLPQKQVLTQLRAQGIHLKPGQSIHYLIRDAGKKIYIPLSLVKDGVFDQDAYRHRLKKAYLTLFLPIHPTMKDIDNLLEGKRQTRLGEYVEVELGLAQA